MNRAAEARELAKALAALAVTRGTARWELPALLLRADADFTLGDHAAASSAFQEAAAKAETTGRLPILWRALPRLAEAQRALGNSTAAEAAAARARGIIERLAASVPDERLRAVFLQSPKV